MIGWSAVRGICHANMLRPLYARSTLSQRYSSTNAVRVSAKASPLGRRGLATSPTSALPESAPKSQGGRTTAVLVIATFATAIGLFQFREQLGLSSKRSVLSNDEPYSKQLDKHSVVQEVSDSKYGTQEDVKAAIEELTRVFPEEHGVDVTPGALKSYGSSDNTYLPVSPHSVVVRPNSTEDVVKIVNISRKYRIPVVPYSGATSLEGHFSGYSSGSICIDMSGMNKILNVNGKQLGMCLL